MKTFERIIKERQYEEFNIVLAEIFYELIEKIKVTDSLAQSLFLNNYSKIVRNSDKLFKKILEKLVNTFIQSADKDEHTANMCLNFLSSMMMT